MSGSEEDSATNTSVTFEDHIVDVVDVPPPPSGGGGRVQDTLDEDPEPTANVVEPAVPSRVRGMDFLAAIDEANGLLSLVNRSSVPDIIGVDFREQQANLSKYVYSLMQTSNTAGSLLEDQEMYKNELETDLSDLQDAYDEKSLDAAESNLFTTPEMEGIMTQINAIKEKLARLNYHSEQSSPDSKVKAFSHLSVYPVDTTGMGDQELANYEQAIENTAGMDSSKYICELGDSEPTQAAIIINRFQTAIDYVNSEGSAFTGERTIDIINRFVTNTNHELGEPTALYKEVVFLNNCAQCSLNPKLLSEMYQRPLSDLAKRIFDLSLSLEKSLGTHELVTLMFGKSGVSALRPNLDSLLTYGLPDYERTSLDAMSFIKSMGPISQADFNAISVALSNKVQGKPQKPKERKSGGKKPK